MARFKPLTDSDVDMLQELIGQGTWVLVATLDGGPESQELNDYLQDERLKDALENFTCFQVTPGSLLATRFGITTTASLTVFSSEESPYASFHLDEPGTWFVEDIIQFLDDQASEILYGDPFDSD